MNETELLKSRVADVRRVPLRKLANRPQEKQADSSVAFNSSI